LFKAAGELMPFFAQAKLCTS